MRCGAVIVAAGAGTRLGGVAKALLPAGDQTFLAHIAATAGTVGVAASDLVVVVAAPFGDAVAAAARTLGALVVHNPDPARGMGSSVACGFAAVPPGLDAAFLWPVDHPWVRASTLAALIAAGGGVPVHHERRGHPPLIPRAQFAALAAAAAHPDGARGVLRGALTAIPVDDPGVLRDVDRPGDLEAHPCVA